MTKWRNCDCEQHSHLAFAAQPLIAQDPKSPRKRVSSVFQERAMARHAPRLTRRLECQPAGRLCRPLFAGRDVPRGEVQRTERGKRTRLEGPAEAVEVERVASRGQVAQPTAYLGPSRVISRVISPRPGGAAGSSRRAARARGSHCRRVGARARCARGRRRSALARAAPPHRRAAPPGARRPPSVREKGSLGSSRLVSPHLGALAQSGAPGTSATSRVAASRPSPARRRARGSRSGGRGSKRSAGCRRG